LKQKENPRGPLSGLFHIFRVVIQKMEGGVGRGVKDFGYAVKKRIFRKITPLLIAITVHVRFFLKGRFHKV
jgi:hypothetical protein